MNFGAPCRAYAAIARGRAEELPLIPAQAGIQAAAGPRFRGDERDDSFGDARLPAGALRARGAECGICRRPIAILVQPTPQGVPALSHQIRHQPSSKRTSAKSARAGETVKPMARTPTAKISRFIADLLLGKM